MTHFQNISTQESNTTLTNASKRDNSLDAAKGLLILMVVYAHCFTEGVLHDFFFSFHMAAFFVISGITAAISQAYHRPIWKSVRKIVRAFVVPYLFFEALGILQELIRNGFSQTWKGLAYNTLTLRCNNIVDWFLGTLLFAKLFALVLNKGLRKSLTQPTADFIYLLGSAVLMIVSVLIPKTTPFPVFILRRVLIANGFIAIGMVLEPLIRRERPLFGIIAFSGAFVLSLLNPDFADINELRFGLPWIFFGAALLGSYGVIQIGKRIGFSPLLWLGKNSLIIMGTHIPILLLLRFAANDTAPKLWNRALDFVLILVLEIPIVWLINRFAPFLIGKPRRRTVS